MYHGGGKVGTKTFPYFCLTTILEAAIELFVIQVSQIQFLLHS